MFYVMLRYFDKFGNGTYVRYGHMKKSRQSAIAFLNRQPHPGVVHEYGKGVIHAKQHA